MRAVVNPGWVQTVMGGPNANLTPAEKPLGVAFTGAGRSENAGNERDRFWHLADNLSGLLDVSF